MQRLTEALFFEKNRHSGADDHTNWRLSASSSFGSSSSPVRLHRRKMMTARLPRRLCSFFLLHFLFLFTPTAAQQFIGLNYGVQADNLPPPGSTASLLQSTTISKLRLYAPDPGIAAALAGTGITLLLGIPNSDVPSLAASASAAASWVAANVPSGVSISAISVGNELLNSGDPSLPPLLLPAMQNIQTALSSSQSTAGIKVSTVHSMAVLSQSDPPSSGAFHPDLSASLDPILAFLSSSGAPFMINPYPYFAYISDTRPDTLAFCLFQPNAGRPDAAAGLTYTNMFDAQLDAIRVALDAKGFPGVDIVIAETGWPYKGDASEVGATVDNARAYNGNLVAHLRSLAGTPRVPGKSVDTYIFALYDEDLKPGPTSERSFGLYKADLTQNYDAGLAKASTSTTPQTTATPDRAPPAPPVGGLPTGWCVTAGESGQIGQAGNDCYMPSASSPRQPQSTMVTLLSLLLLIRLIK